MNSNKIDNSSLTKKNHNTLNLKSKSNTERMIEWLEKKPKLWRVSSSFINNYCSSTLILRSRTKRKKNVIKI